MAVAALICRRQPAVSWPGRGRDHHGRQVHPQPAGGPGSDGPGALVREPAG